MAASIFVNYDAFAAATKISTAKDFLRQVKERKPALAGAKEVTSPSRMTSSSIGKLFDRFPPLAGVFVIFYCNGVPFEKIPGFSSSMPSTTVPEVHSFSARWNLLREQDLKENLVAALGNLVAEVPSLKTEYHSKITKTAVVSLLTRNPNLWPRFEQHLLSHLFPLVYVSAPLTSSEPLTPPTSPSPSKPNDKDANYFPAPRTEPMAPRKPSPPLRQPARMYSPPPSPTLFSKPQPPQEEKPKDKQEGAGDPVQSANLYPSPPNPEQYAFKSTSNHYFGGQGRKDVSTFNFSDPSDDEEEEQEEQEEQEETRGEGHFSNQNAFQQARSPSVHLGQSPEPEMTPYEQDLAKLRAINHKFYEQANGKTCHCSTQKGQRCKGKLLAGRAVCSVHARTLLN